jgi:hypothetical protein
LGDVERSPETTAGPWVGSIPAAGRQAEGARERALADGGEPGVRADELGSDIDKRVGTRGAGSPRGARVAFLTFAAVTAPLRSCFVPTLFFGSVRAA